MNTGDLCRGGEWDGEGEGCGDSEREERGVLDL